MGVEDLAEALALSHDLLDGAERLRRSGGEGGMPCRRLADQYGAHQRNVVVMPDAGEFERDLVTFGKVPPARFVAAEQGIRSRTDDELVAGIVAAALEDSALHGGKDVGFVGPGA